MADRCHLCGHDLADALHVHDEGRPYTGPLHTVACSECSLVQTVPHPTAAEVADYYASGRYRMEFPDLPKMWIGDDGQPDPSRLIDPSDPLYELTCDRHGQHAAQRLAVMLEITAPMTSVLEVGCGDGRVSGWLRAGGVDVQAVEADPKKRKEAEARGVSVWSDINEPPPSMLYDRVFALQVAEHFADPIGGLASIVQRATPGGLVFVEVPAVERPYVSLSHFLQKPHVVNYSAHTLAAAMRCAGLDEVHTALDGNVLMGWGVRGTAERRPYEPHGGPPAAQIVGTLHKWERERAERETAERYEAAFLNPSWREVAAVTDRDQATLDHMAAEFVKWRDVGTDAIYSIAKLCKRIDDEHGDLETWHANAWVRGYHAGVAAERQRLGVILGNMSNGLLVKLNRKEAP